MTTYGPSWARYRAYLFVIAPVAVLLVSLDFVRNRTSAPLVAALIGGVLVLVAIYLLLFFRNYRITAELHYLDLRNWLGFSRTLGPDVLDRVVLVEAYTDNGATVPYFMVIDRNGKRVLALNGRFWGHDQMTQLARTLELPVDAVSAARPRDLRRNYPKAVGRVAAHPYIAGLLIALGVVVVLLLGAVLWVALTY